MRSEECLSAIENAHPGRSVELVAGEGEEVAAELLDIYLEMGSRLRPIHQHGNPAGMGELDQVLDRVDGAERVGQVHHRDEAGPIAQEPLECVNVQLAGVGDGSGRAVLLPSARRPAARGRCWSGAPSR